jgi:hypothetical protein
MKDIDVAANSSSVEAVDVLIGSVPFLQHPVCGFIRLVS